MTAALNRMELLAELADAFGVSSDESEVRQVLVRYAPPNVQVDFDNLGGIYLTDTGSSKSPVILLAAHMDEIGFMVTHVTETGFLRFRCIGRWRENTLPGLEVLVRGRKGDVWGVIGTVPPHLLSEADAQKPLRAQDMFIDIGASSRASVVRELGIRPGDLVVPNARSRVLSNSSLIAGKAWDNRAGCALLIEALTGLGEHPNTVVSAGTAQEEVGRRGAGASAVKTNPDIAFVLEGILAGDQPGIDRELAPTALGKGPVLVFFDDSMIPNRRLLDFAIDTCEAEGIPYQLVPARGGNDAGIIHVHNLGIPCLVLGVPARYIHANTGILDANDVELAGRMLRSFMRRLDAKTVEWIKAFSRS
jgi:putative aminopeptidase FrvX